MAHGDPGNDHPAVMLALDAEFVIQGPDGKRTQPANGFFMGTYWTALEDGDNLEAKACFDRANALRPGGDAASQLWSKECEQALREGRSVGVRSMSK